MNEDKLLSRMSLLTLLLVTIHLAYDTVYGKDGMSLVGLIGCMIVMAVWLYAALLLGARSAGRVLMLLFAVLGVVVSVLHALAPGGVMGGHIAQSAGAFFVWGLIVIGAISVFTIILSARLLLGRRSEES